MGQETLKYSPNLDVKVNKLNEVMPEGNIKAYPYRFSSHDKDKSFLKPNTTTIAQITQSYYKQDDGSVVLHNLDYDSTIDAYSLNILAATTINGQLDISLATSTTAKTIKMEKNFVGLTNQFFDHKKEEPIFFTFNEPYDYDKYMAGEQAVYIAVEIIPAENSQIAGIQQAKGSLNTDSLTEINFVRVEALEAQYVNASIIFINQNESNTKPKNMLGNNGVSLEVENHTLINFIKAKGETVETGSNIVERGEIDLASEQKMMPVKMTPFSISEKVEMLCDWFDYDVYMPYVVASTLRTNNNIKSVIDNDDDLTLIKDMLIMSYGFASNWASAPVITNSDKGDNGKIDPSFRITSKGIKVTNIVNTSPIQVVDSIYERYIRENPGFLMNRERYQKVRGVLNGLSRYIYSSYVVGKGMNSFNQAYSPWFLDIAKQISFDDTVSEKVSIKNPDAGATGNVDTRVLKDVLVTVLSSYMTDYFTDLLNKTPSATITLPSKPLLSNSVILQTDRKVSIPNIKDVLDEVGKPSLPGDVNTSSSQDLKYLWWLPVQNDTTMEQFYMDKLTDVTSVTSGQQLQVQYPNANGLGDPGRYYTEDEVRAGIQTKVPGNLVTPFTKEATRIFVGRYKLNGGLTNSTAYVKVGTAGIGAASYNVMSDYYATFQHNDDSDVLNGHNPTYSMIDTISGRTGWGHRTTSSETENLPTSDGKWITTPTANPKDNMRPINNPQGTWMMDNVTRQEYYSFSYGNQHYSFQMAVEADVYVYAEQYPEWTVIASGDISVTTHSFSSRQIIFDKQNWRRFLSKFNIIPNGYTRIDLRQAEDFQIERLDEIILGSVWGNKMRIIFQGFKPIEIPMINKDDETIAIQRILFY